MNDPSNQKKIFKQLHYSKERAEHKKLVELLKAKRAENPTKRFLFGIRAHVQIIDISDSKFVHVLELYV